MAVKIRKQIYIEPHQEQILKRLARVQKMPEAEIIRHAIDEYARSMPHIAGDLSVWEKERAFIEQLMSQGPVKGGRAWRREELYER